MSSQQKLISESSTISAGKSFNEPTDFISKPWTTPNSDIPLNILELDHSFGYNCKRFFNLCMINSNIVVFASGNLIHFYNVEEKKMTFRRSAGSGGIGCIIKNPNPEYNYLTVAENGQSPLVIIYKYPEMDVISILKHGAESSYSRLDYTPDGELLVTQAGEPDYMLTIWKWKTSSIVLRVKSFGNDIYNVKFSKYNPTQLTTCGSGHIKFWKMSETFTGLKLQGSLGRFGKTEICDIYAIYPMPDEKVISGCEWGNMIVWEEGLIKLEVCRKNRKPCHDAPITQISMEEGEVTTVGMDGYIRIWFWETVELADPSEEDHFVEIEPIYEFKIGTKNHICQLMCLIKRYPDQKNNYKYFTQDGISGIWLCDLNPEKNPDPPAHLFSCHEGGIEAIDASAISTHIATLDIGGRLHLYNYVTKKLICKKQFGSAGTDLIWFPTKIDPSGCVIAAVFDDGVIRLLLADIDEEKENTIQLLQAIKAHTDGITRLSMNPKQTIVVTVSKDKTIFVLQIKPSHPYVTLSPIGFLEIPSIPTCLNWKPNSRSTILIGGSQGEILEGDVPETPRTYTEESFHLKNVLLKTFQFKSIKSVLKQKAKLEEKRAKKDEKRAKKAESLLKLKNANPGVEIDEETYLADSEPEEETEPLYVPKTPNKILWLKYTPNDTVWFSVAGYDSGYIYEFSFKDRTVNVTGIPVCGADDLEISSYLYKHQYLIFGMEDGSIRVNAIKKNFRDFTEYWILNMHDNLNGAISEMCASYDGNYIFSVGLDGNLFSYKWTIPVKIKPLLFGVMLTEEFNVTDIDDRNFLSLEQQKLKNVEDRRNKVATERKDKVFDILSDYKVQYKEIVKRNRALPKSQQYTQNDLETDPRVTKDLMERLEEQLDIVRRKMAYDVEKATLGREKVMNYFIHPLEGFPFEVLGIRSNVSVKSFRIQKLDEEFWIAREDLERRIRKELENPRVIQILDDVSSKDENLPAQSQESFLKEMPLTANDIKLDSKMKRILEKYRTRKTRQKERKCEWEKINFEKPDPHKNHEEDNRAIEEASKTIGDYKLKTDPNYEPVEGDTTLKKYKELLQAREDIFNIRNGYNKKLLEMRKKKMQLHEYIDEKRKLLSEIHQQIPKSLHKHVESVPVIDRSREYPEECLNTTAKPSSGVEVKDLFIKKPIIPANPSDRPLRIKEEYNKRLEWKVLGLSSNMELMSLNDVYQFVNKFPKLSEQNKEIFEELAKNEDATPWEAELRYLTVMDMAFEQDVILQEIDDQIIEFDNELNVIAEERLNVDIDAKFLENYLLTLNQELWILREYEQLEDDLVNKVENTIKERNKIQADIIKRKCSIEMNRKNIEQINEAKNTVQKEFAANIKGSKFGDFLQKIFRKKFKPGRMLKSAGSAELSDTTDTSEEENENNDYMSLDSHDISPYQLDESVCPSGCDKNIYDQTFLLRARRYSLEQEVFKEQKEIEDTQKKIDELKTMKKNIAVVLSSHQTELTVFRHDKQETLNQVETLVVLKMDQIQHFKDIEDLSTIDSTLLFKLSNVSKLYTRVGQLGVETLEAKRKHQVNIVHLSRMKSDCNYMSRQIDNLKGEIDKAMIKKFGTIVDLDELEESVLKEFIFNMKVDLEAERKDIEKQIAEKKEILSNAETELIRQIQVGTEKLNILTVLHEEKNYLSEILMFQKKLVNKTETVKHLDLKPDLKKLKDITKQQDQQIKFLEKEIRTLRLKSKPFATAAQEYETGALTEILPPQQGERDYEEAVYINVQNSSPRESDFETIVPDKVKSIVKKFILKTLGSHLDEPNIQKYTRKISKYLAYVMSNIGPEQSEKLTSSVIENLQHMIPQKFLIYIKPDDIGILFQEVIGLLNQDDNEVNIDEVIAAIVTNAVEMCSQLKSTNFAQDVVCEIFRELIEVLPIDDITDDHIIQQISTCLCDIPEIKPNTINITKLSEEIMNYAKENSNDELNLDIVKSFAQTLLSHILSKIDIRI